MKKTTFYLLLLLAASTLSSSCQEKKQTDKPKKQDTLMDMKTNFEWQEGLSCPSGYPIQVYRGWLEGPIVGKIDPSPNSTTSISGFGTTTGIGDWGENSSGMSIGEKPIPKSLNCIWYSYVEDVMYGIDTELDYPKMVKLFNEGYQDSNQKMGKVMKTYDTITVGFAPGGVVVVWLQNGGRQVEIGRYQGEKTEISPEEIASLDSHERLLFDPADRERTLKNPGIISPEVQEANKNKPIPYGLWDSYRIKYSWRPTFVLVREGKVQDAILSFYMFNGERETLLDNEVTENLYRKRAIPKGLYTGWWDKTGQGYGGDIYFDEKEIFAAFKELYKKNPEANIDLEIKINPGSIYLGISLKNGINDIPLRKSKVDVYESRSLTERYKFNWRPVFVFPEGEKMPYKIYFLTNTFGQFPAEKEFTNMPFQENGVPYKISFDYYEEKGKSEYFELTWDGELKRIMGTFKEIDRLKPGAPIEMEIKIGKNHSSCIITLKGNGKEVPVKFNFFMD